MRPDLAELMRDMPVPAASELPEGAAWRRVDDGIPDKGTAVAECGGAPAPFGIFHAANAAERPDPAKYLCSHGHVAGGRKTVPFDIDLVAIAEDALIGLLRCQPLGTADEHPYVTAHERDIRPVLQRSHKSARPSGRCNAIGIDEGDDRSARNRGASVAGRSRPRFQLDLEPDSLELRTDIRRQRCRSIVHDDDLDRKICLALPDQGLEAAPQIRRLVEVRNDDTDCRLGTHLIVSRRSMEATIDI